MSVDEDTLAGKGEILDFLFLNLSPTDYFGRIETGETDLQRCGDRLLNRDRHTVPRYTAAIPLDHSLGLAVTHLVEVCERGVGMA